MNEKGIGIAIRTNCAPFSSSYTNLALRHLLDPVFRELISTSATVSIILLLLLQNKKGVSRVQTLSLEVIFYHSIILGRLKMGGACRISGFLGTFVVRGIRCFGKRPCNY